MAQDFQQLRLMAFRRRSLLKKPGLNENLRLWLSIEVGELASFTEEEIKRVISGTAPPLYRIARDQSSM